MVFLGRVVLLFWSASALANTFVVAMLVSCIYHTFTLCFSVCLVVGERHFCSSFFAPVRFSFILVCNSIIWTNSVVTLFPDFYLWLILTVIVFGDQYLHVLSTVLLTPVWFSLLFFVCLAGFCFVLFYFVLVLFLVLFFALFEQNVLVCVCVLSRLYMYLCCCWIFPSAAKSRCEKC